MIKKQLKPAELSSLTEMIQRLINGETFYTPSGEAIKYSDDPAGHMTFYVERSGVDNGFTTTTKQQVHNWSIWRVVHVEVKPLWHQVIPESGLLCYVDNPPGSIIFKRFDHPEPYRYLRKIMRVERVGPGAGWHFIDDFEQRWQRAAPVDPQKLKDMLDWAEAIQRETIT